MTSCILFRTVEFISVMSSGPYLCYRELLSATGIELAAFFQSFDENRNYSQFLITLSLSTISIYKCINSPTNCDDILLILVYRDKVFGKPQDIKVIKGSTLNREDKGDKILISYDIAKYIIVKYVPMHKRLDVLHMANIEDNAIGLGSKSKIKYRIRSNAIGLGAIPILAIDEDNYFAASLLYGQYLVFFPSYGNKLDISENPQEISDVFFADLHNSLQLIGPILDICFIQGYNRPTLAVLMETGLLPIGHAAKVRYTYSLVLLTVNVHLKNVSILWQHNNLPHDSLRIYPIPSNNNNFKGCVFLVSMNACIVISQFEFSSIATNSFASLTVHNSCNLQDSNLDVGFELDSSNWHFTDSRNFIGFLKDGSILLVRMLPLNHVSIGTSRIKFDLSLIGVSVPSSFICSSNNDKFWFVGSKHADAMMLSVSRTEVNGEDLMQPLTFGSANIVTPAPKRQRKSIGNKGSIGFTSETPGEMVLHSAEMDLEETSLYGNPIDSTQNPSSRQINVVSSIVEYALDVIDSVPVLPPILSTAICKQDNTFDYSSNIVWNQVGEPLKTTSQVTPGSYIADSEAKNSLIVSAGINEFSSMYRFSVGLRFMKILSRNIIGIISFTTLIISDSIDNITTPSQLLFLNYEKATKILHLSESSANEIQSRELSAECGFLTSSTTLFAGLMSENYIVQAFSNGIRLVRISVEFARTGEGNCEALQDMLLSESEELGGFGLNNSDSILTAWISLNSVFILTQKYQIFEINFDIKDELLMLGKSNVYESYHSVSNISRFHGNFQLTEFSENELDNAKPMILSEQDQEEKYLYNASVLLHEEANEIKKMDVFDSDDITTLDNSSSYYIFVSNGFVIVSDHYDINDEDNYRVLFPNIHEMPEVIDVSSLSSNWPKTSSAYDDKNIVKSACLVSLGPSDFDLLQSLCLVCLLNDGTLLVYEAFYIKNKITKFLKVKHNIVRRVYDYKYREDSSEIVPGLRERQISLSVMQDANGSTVVVVAGCSPLLISCANGRVAVSPIGFPELPFSNLGELSILPLHVGGIRGLVTLWTEFFADDIINNREGNQAILGFYEEIPGLQLSDSYNSGSNLSTKKLNCYGMTIHKCSEIVRNRIEDKNEAYMLEKKTLVMATSNEVSIPFRNEVLSETEIARIPEDFAHNFPDVVSFFQPQGEIPATGAEEVIGQGNHNNPCPMLKERMYRIALMQGTTVIDEYFLGEDEMILDIEVVYIAPEKPAPVPFHGGHRKGNFPLPPPTILPRRSFIIVGTSLADKRGEDTPGDGRLLVFGIEYNRFQSHQGSNTSDEEASKKDTVVPLQIDTSAGPITVITNSSDISKKNVPGNPSGIMQPKLSLLSSNVGPASVIKQFGNDRVLSTLGSIVFIHKLNGETMNLDQISFYYAKVSLIKFILHSRLQCFIYLVLRVNCHYSEELYLYWRCNESSTTIVLARRRLLIDPNIKGS